MILADISAWLEYDRATGSQVDVRLTALIADTDEVAVTEPVMMEVLAGARDDRREQDLRRLLDRCHLLRFDPVVHFPGAVRIYRSCRRVGVTPRGLVGCMIAAVASGAATDTVGHCPPPDHEPPTLRPRTRSTGHPSRAGDQPRPPLLPAALVDRPEYTWGMHEERDVAEVRAATRATLLSEERAVGSEDPKAQAREVLRDSGHRRPEDAA